MYDLPNHRAIVCGSSQGIGRACAEQLALLGAGVTIISRNESALRDVHTSLSTSAGQTHYYLVGDTSQPQKLKDQVLDHLKIIGTVHILINNTGGPPAGKAIDASPEDFLTAYTSHLFCAQLLTQIVVPGMKAERYGRIINIISSSVIQPIPGLGVSNTTRGAMANWGRTLAGELGPFGITVNNILPGAIDTTRLRSLFEKKAAGLGKTTGEIVQERLTHIPAGRFGEPAEIGRVVAFLASPAASYVSGVNLPVDGGQAAVQS